MNEEEKKSKKRLLLLLLLLLLFIAVIIGTVIFLKDDGKAEASEDEISIASTQEENTNDENKEDTNSDSTDTQVMTNLFAINKNKTKKVSSYINSSANNSAVLRDTTAPEISGVDNNKWYENSVSVTINDESEYTAILKDEDGNSVPYVSGSEITEEGNYTLTVTDIEGNETSVTFGIDNTAPTIEIAGNPTEWQNTDAVLTITASDNLSGVDSVTVNGTDITDEVEYTISENGTYEFIVTDNVGNVATQTVIVNKIDKVLPELNVTGNPTEWQNTDAVLTISASDNLSGVDSVTVNGTDITDEVEYTISANGTYEFTVTDNAGNMATQTVVVDKIDKTAPSVTVNGQMGFLMINATDSESGVKSVVIKVNGQERTLNSMYNGQYFYMLNQRPGSQAPYYELTVTDNAGNKTVKNNDTTAPTIEITGNPTEWQNTDAILTISASDNLSGVDSVTVNGADITGEVAYTVSANGTYEFAVTDKAGNVTTQIVVVNKIDKALPVLNVTGNPTEWQNTDAVLTISASDNLSGVDSVTVNGADITGEGSYTVSANGTYEFAVTDNAGNVTTQTVVVNKIDKTAPTVSANRQWMNLIVNATDSESGIKSVVVNGQDITSTLSAGRYTYRITNMWGSITVVVTDNAGNVTTYNA